MTLISISSTSWPSASPFPLNLKVVTIITQDPLSIMQPHFFLPKCVSSPPAAPIPIFIASHSSQAASSGFPYSHAIFQASLCSCYSPTSPPSGILFVLQVRGCKSNTGARQKSYLSVMGQYRMKVHFNRGMLICIVTWKQQCKNNDIELPILGLCVGEIGRDEGLVTDSRTRVP